MYLEDRGSDSGIGRADEDKEVLGGHEQIQRYWGRCTGIGKAGADTEVFGEQGGYRGIGRAWADTDI